MFKKYFDSLPARMHFHELTLGLFRSGGLRVTPSCRKEHDALQIIRLYKDTMREYSIELFDPLASVYALIQ